jgi:hypothetical protein
MDSVQYSRPIDPDAVLEAAREMNADPRHVRIGLTAGQMRALGVRPETPPKYRLRLGQAKPAGGGRDSRPIDPDAVARAATEMLADQRYVRMGLTAGQMRALGIRPETPPKYRLRLKKGL